MKKYVYSEAKQVVVCGDIHGAFETLVYKSCVQYSMTDTVIIVAGDCGFGFEKPNYYTTLYNRLSGRLRKANNWVVFVKVPQLTLTMSSSRCLILKRCVSCLKDDGTLLSFDFFISS